MMYQINSIDSTIIAIPVRRATQKLFFSFRKLHILLYF